MVSSPYSYLSFRGSVQRDKGKALFDRINSPLGGNPWKIVDPFLVL